MLWNFPVNWQVIIRFSLEIEYLHSFRGLFIPAFLVEDRLRHGVDLFLQIHIGCHVKTYSVESRNDEDQICAFSQTPHNFIRRWLHIVPSTYRKRINKKCDTFISDLGSFLEKSFSSIKKKSLQNYCVFRLTSSKMGDHTFLRKSFNKSRTEGGIVFMPKSPTKSACLHFEVLKTEKVF